MNKFELLGKHYIDTIREFGMPALVYGMGNGADKVIDLFGKKNIPVLGVTAGDDFVRGQIFRGYTVTRLNDFKGEFVITPAFGTSLPDVMAHIISLNKSYNLIYPAVPVVGDETADNLFFDKYSERIERAYSLLNTESRKVFTGYLQFLYTGKLQYLLDITSDKNDIFNDFLRLDGSGVYIDIGAYRGDTIREYLDYTGGKYEEIIAIEPDKKNYTKLSDNFSEYDNLTLINKVCSDKTDMVLFDSACGRQSSVNEKGKLTPSVTVDEAAGDKIITYIKIDAEGEEMNIINGAKNTIKRCKPKLNIALYHKFSDIFEIPLRIAEINPDYRFEIRHHPYIPAWDTNLYC
ncbi:MAG: FkbM family methyltransferase, partial [Clostridia bacterium]|nr:FkbM family methyltransferase [Clostridia bacterium]